MKRLANSVLLIVPLFLLTSWGFFAHQRINNLAVFTLPGGMIRFYKQNIRYITEHAVDPDKRRYADTLEAPRHYLDVEDYESSIDSIPERWDAAMNKYGPTKLKASGILPWHIQKCYYNLVNAFKTHDSLRILKISADLGHYIGDAHVPLHTTSNHNGQLTNQSGIHAFWESRLPELFSTEYNFSVGKAKYIENPLKKAWEIIKHTHSLVDTVLTFEARLSAVYPSDQKYSYSERSNTVLKQYAADYSRAYHKQMNHMVERQMRSAILEIGSFWYSAWVDAGQPELKNLLKIERNENELKEEKEMEKQYQKGVRIGREL